MILFNISEEYSQKTRLKFEEEEIALNIFFGRFGWFMNVEFREKEYNGIKLVSGVYLMKEFNLPFCFVINDKLSNLDPFAIDSFSSTSFEFYMLERDEMKELRGFDVR